MDIMDSPYRGPIWMAAIAALIILPEVLPPMPQQATMFLRAHDYVKVFVSYCWRYLRMMVVCRMYTTAATSGSCSHISASAAMISTSQDIYRLAYGQ